ncbi:MAG: 4-(cytidine 5'-diphospho)-2-C-methyl-D-erythritol kinase [Elusimicrobiales bacterium]
MSFKANAKINLFLEVIGKRNDGYHDIVSVFARISLCDKIRLEKNKRFETRIFVKNNVNMPDIELKDNLVWKAVKRFEERFGYKCGYDVYIEKNIPVGAGLGGGSSDCAATLIALSKIYGINKENIYPIACELGSDVAFFTRNSMLCAGTGRGEILKDIELKARLPGLVIVFPDIYISSAKVYSSLNLNYNPDLKRFEVMIDAFKKEEDIDFSHLLFNRLEEAAFMIEPKVERLKKRMSELGLVSMMSGSGSSVFGLSYSTDLLDKAYDELKKIYRFVFKAKFV